MDVAVIGCIVNGPGEAREADLGLAAGKGRGHLFIKGEVVRVVPEEEMVDALAHEALLLADRFAHAGIATFTIDAVGHGQVLPNAERLIMDFLGDGIDEETALTLAKTLLGDLIYKDADKRFPEGTTACFFGPSMVTRYFPKSE